MSACCENLIRKHAAKKCRVFRVGRGGMYGYHVALKPEKV